MAKASARHILVPSEADCNTLKNMIEGGDDFAEIAKVHSKCPSGKEGVGTGRRSGNGTGVGTGRS